MIMVLSLILVIFNQQFILKGGCDEEYNIISLQPSEYCVTPLEEFMVGVHCTPSQDMKSFECSISFDPMLLSAVIIHEGDIFSDFETFFNNGTIDNEQGRITLTYGLILGEGTIQEPGYLYWVEFKAQDCIGISDICLFNVGITNETTYLPVNVINGSVQIKYKTPIIENISYTLTDQIDPTLPFGSYTIHCDIQYCYEHNVFLSVSFPNGSFNTLPMEIISDTQYYCMVDFLNFGTYGIFIYVVDEEDNTTYSKESVFELPYNGDVNVDGYVNYVDALLVWAHRDNNPSMYPYDGRYDMNGDGQINYIDVLLVWNEKE